MEPLLNVSFVLADAIIKGLESGELVRIGGVIREVASGKIVTFLREASSNISTIPQQIQMAQGALMIGSVASVLSLGVSVAGFTMLNQRINDLEKRLKQTEELLNKLNQKIDIGYYANFKAALNLATNAFSMTQLNNRQDMAIQAINRFLEAEHIFTDYTDRELASGSQIADEYLLTLSLAYIAEARCYLELGEYKTALIRFQEGSQIIRERIQKYVELLLTSNPAVYLQPEFENQIDLKRLTRIYQWMNSDSGLDENAVFQKQRQNFFEYVRDPDKWVNSLPSAILNRVEVAGWIFVGPSSDDLKKEAFKRLPSVFEVIESMVETNRRFEAYELEIKTIINLGITFSEWLNLTPSEEKPEGANFMFILPSEPLAV
jgi:hypothetical protein